MPLLPDWKYLAGTSLDATFHLDSTKRREDGDYLLMVAYNFKSQFVPLIESGQKLQTIRALGKRRPPMPGEPLQLYTGMRTKQCRKLLDPDPLCVAVTPIRIYWLIGSVTKERMVALSSSSEHWITLTETRRQQLAIADGFQSFDELFAFFQNTHDLPFEGVLITWRLPVTKPIPAGQGKDPTRIQLPLQEIA